MISNLNVDSKPFSYWPPLILVLSDQSSMFTSTYDNHLITSMVFEWNES